MTDEEEKKFDVREFSDSLKKNRHIHHCVHLLWVEVFRIFHHSTLILQKSHENRKWSFIKAILFCTNGHHCKLTCRLAFYAHSTLYICYILLYYTILWEGTLWGCLEKNVVPKLLRTDVMLLTSPNLNIIQAVCFAEKTDTRPILQAGNWRIFGKL